MMLLYMYAHGARKIPSDDAWVISPAMDRFYNNQYSGTHSPIIWIIRDPKHEQLELGLSFKQPGTKSLDPWQ